MSRDELVKRKKEAVKELGVVTIKRAKLLREIHDIYWKLKDIKKERQDE